MNLIKLVHSKVYLIKTYNKSKFIIISKYFFFILYCDVQTLF
jgi:hypothetical protein